MNNKDKYERVPLKPAKAQEIIIALFAGEDPVSRKQIIRDVINEYTSNDGLEPEGDPVSLIKTALRNLKKAGQAENVDDILGYWRILPSSDDDQGDLLVDTESDDERVKELVEGMLSVIRDEIDTLAQQKSHLEDKCVSVCLIGVERHSYLNKDLHHRLNGANFF